MKKEKMLAGVLGVLMVVTVVGLGGVFWSATRPKVVEKKEVKSSQTNPVSGNSSLSVGNNSGLGAGVEGQSQSIGSTGSSGEASAPKQEDFSQYEKYKNDKSALFGEISPGTGNEVKKGSKVAIYYIGRLTNGTIFDNQWPAKPGDTPKPFEFEIGTDKIIAGLQQGMVGMKSGGKRRIIIPPAVGYGDKGQGSIPPSSVLIFDIDLLSVK